MMDREAFDKRLEERREKSITKLRIRLSSEGMRFEKRKAYIEAYKATYFTKEASDCAYKVECTDIDGYLNESKLYQPNILERNFRRGASTRNK